MLKLWVSAFRAPKVTVIPQVQSTGSPRPLRGGTEKRNQRRKDHLSNRTGEMGVKVEHSNTESAFSDEVSSIPGRDEALKGHREKRAAMWLERPRKFVWKGTVPENLKLSTDFSFMKMISWTRCFQRRPEGLTETEEEARDIKQAHNSVGGFKKKKKGQEVVRCEDDHMIAQTTPAWAGWLYQTISKMLWLERTVTLLGPTPYWPKS